MKAGSSPGVLLLGSSRVSVNEPVFIFQLFFGEVSSWHVSKMPPLTWKQRALSIINIRGRRSYDIVIGTCAAQIVSEEIDNYRIRL